MDSSPSRKRSHMASNTALLVVDPEGAVYEMSAEGGARHTNVAFVVGCLATPVFSPPLQQLIDELPVRCMRPCDLEAYLQHERLPRATPFQLRGAAPYHPSIFAAFTIA